MSEPITVLVTAIGGAGHGEQILKALLLADRYRIIGADMNAGSPQFRLVDHGVRLPRATDPEYLDALLAVCDHFGVRAVFHGCEPDLAVLATHQDLLRERGLLVPVNPLALIETCMDKRSTNAFLADHGFVAVGAESLAQLGEPADEVFPLVAKPAVGSGGSADCYIIQDQQELEIARAACGDDLDRMMVQRYVGTPENEFTVGVLHDLDGNFVNSIAVRRDLSGLGVRLSVPNRTGHDEFGPRLVISSGISQGYVDRFPEVTGPCEEIAAALGARGPINVQCRFVDGEVKVFEINPRFSGTTSLRAMMGYNEPDLLLRRHLEGESLEPRFGYRSGHIARSLTETLVDWEPAPDWQSLG